MQMYLLFTYCAQSHSFCFISNHGQYLQPLLLTKLLLTTQYSAWWAGGEQY